MQKNVSDKHLKGRVVEIYQAIQTIGEENETTQKLAIELVGILKELIERKELTKAERIKHEKNQRILMSQIFMDAIYPVLFEENV